MELCSNCGTKVSKTILNYTGKRVCNVCIPLTQSLHIDNVSLTEAGPILVEPFSDAEEKVKREKLVAFIHLIFPKVNPAAYRLMNSYRKKGYTWLGMIRALEYFYVIKHNSKQKSNNNIGIIPHVYEDAQKFYKYQADKLLQKAKRWHENKEFVPSKIIIEKEEKRSNAEIDMSDL